MWHKDSPHAILARVDRTKRTFSTNWFVEFVRAAHNVITRWWPRALERVRTAPPPPPPNPPPPPPQPPLLRPPPPPPPPPLTTPPSRAREGTSPTARSRGFVAHPPPPPNRGEMRPGTRGKAPRSGRFAIPIPLLIYYFNKSKIKKFTCINYVIIM